MVNVDGRLAGNFNSACSVIVFNECNDSNNLDRKIDLDRKFEKNNTKVQMHSSFEEHVSVNAPQGIREIVFREIKMVSVYVIFTLFTECHTRSLVSIKTQTQTHKHCFQQCGFIYVQISTDTFSLHNTFSTHVSATQHTYVLH